MRKRKKRLSGATLAALTKLYRAAVKTEIDAIKNFQRFGKKRQTKYRRKIRTQLRPQFLLARDMLSGVKKFVRRHKKSNCALGEDRRVVLRTWNAAGVLYRQLL